MLAFVVLAVTAKVVEVSNYAELRRALVAAKPGTSVLMKAGDYVGGFQIEDIHGGLEKYLISVGGADPMHPPRIIRGGMHFVRVSYIEIHDLEIIGPGGNGLNTDDGGERDNPSTHVVYNRIVARGFSGPGDVGLKMAGVDEFAMKSCTVENYSVCGIDLVGCHFGGLANCTIKNGTGVGVQAKGASSDVSILDCRLTNFGGRGINLGGSTGTPYFRPPLESIPLGRRYEAKDCRVEDCTFEGGDAAIAFINLDGASVRYNTIINPNRWAFRILQETSAPGFIPSRGGTFSNNVVKFRSDRWLEGGVNVGPNTEPGSFRFSNNVWSCTDKPDRSFPQLPTKEVNGRYGVDPSTVTGVGAHAKRS